MKRTKPSGKFSPNKIALKTPLAWKSHISLEHKEMMQKVPAEARSPHERKIMVRWEIMSDGGGPFH